MVGNVEISGGACISGNVLVKGESTIISSFVTGNITIEDSNIQNAQIDANCKECGSYINKSTIEDTTAKGAFKLDGFRNIPKNTEITGTIEDGERVTKLDTRMVTTYIG